MTSADTSGSTSGIDDMDLVLDLDCIALRGDLRMEVSTAHRLQTFRDFRVGYT